MKTVKTSVCPSNPAQVPIEPRRLKRLNQRQRKKQRVGEFREFVFELRFMFRQPLDAIAHDRFLEGLIEVVERRGLVVGGFGGKLPLAATDGVVATGGRGSPLEDDRAALLEWARKHPIVAATEAGEFVDAWHAAPA